MPLHPRLLSTTVLFASLFLPAMSANAQSTTESLNRSVAQDYQQHLGALFDHFHRNPELSGMEVNTAARIGKELRAAGYTVTEKVGGTGVVALLKNGDGPMVLLRADMDGLPVEEKSGLANASKVQMKDPAGNLVPVMHACGHDVHITSMVGTARYMATHKEQWRGTLMLVGQPAEETVGGAQGMVNDRLFERFGKPDYAIALHVASDIETGKVWIEEGATHSGVDAVDIIVHGVGAHGASPHRGRDPVVIGAQIVMALQTIVSREVAPREPAVITVGSFHSGTKHNIIPDQAHLQLTVRSENPQTRALLLDAIKRVAINTARAAGVAESMLPEVIVANEATPPVVNDIPLAKRLKAAVQQRMPANTVFDYKRLSMGSEDFGFFTMDPYIPSVYFKVGGTPAADFAKEQQGGPAVPSHHSPLFKISAEPAVRTGVEASVVMLLDLMPVK